MTAMPVSPSVSPRVFGVSPLRSDGELLALRFAPDGRLWSVEEGGVLRQWDVATRRQLAWHELMDPAALWCFSPSAHYIASGSNEISLWQTATGELQACWPQPSWVTALAFQPGGLLLAVGHDDGTLHLWDHVHQTLVHQLPGNHSTISALAFRPDGKVLACADESKIIRLWDVSSGEPCGQLIGHTDRVPALAWHPDGRRLISAGWDTTARVWDTATGEPIVLLNSHAEQVQMLALSPDGVRLACADSAHAVHIWDVEQNRTLAILREHEGEVRGLSFSADGQCLISGGAGRVLHVWDSQAESDKQEETDSQLARVCLAVSADGRCLASLAVGTSLRVWDTATAETAAQLEDAPLLRSFAASPDGRWFAGSLATSEKPEPDRATLALWRTDTGRRERILEGQAAPITALAFRSDSEMLASGSVRSSDVWLWSIPSGEPLLLLGGAVEGCGVEALAFHPGGRLLAIGGVDWLAPRGAQGRIAVWDVIARRVFVLLPCGCVSLAFHPSGRYLAGATLARSIVVWDAGTWQPILELAGHVDSVTCIAFSADGRWLASGSDDRTVRLWDAETGSLRGVVELDTQIKALAFAPDGQSLYTGNGTRSCYQFEVRQIVAV